MKKLITLFTLCLFVGTMAFAQNDKASENVQTTVSETQAVQAEQVTPVAEIDAKAKTGYNAKSGCSYKSSSMKACCRSKGTSHTCCSSKSKAMKSSTANADTDTKAIKEEKSTDLEN